MRRADSAACRRWINHGRNQGQLLAAHHAGHWPRARRGTCRFPGATDYFLPSATVRARRAGVGTWNLHDHRAGRPACAESYLVFHFSPGQIARPLTPKLVACLDDLFLPSRECRWLKISIGMTILNRPFEAIGAEPREG